MYLLIPDPKFLAGNIFFSRSAGEKGQFGVEKRRDGTKSFWKSRNG